MSLDKSHLRNIYTLQTILIYPDLKPLYSKYSCISSISYLIRLMDYLYSNDISHLEHLIQLQEFLLSLKKKSFFDFKSLAIEIQPLTLICKDIIIKAGFEPDYPAKMFFSRVLNECSNIHLPSYYSISYSLSNDDKINKTFLNPELIRVCKPSFLEYLSFISSNFYFDLEKPDF